MLTMHVFAHSYNGPSIYDNREAFFYEVDGLPVGEFATAEEALASLN
jgi:hypothetical protein